MWEYLNLDGLWLWVWIVRNNIDWGLLLKTILSVVLKFNIYFEFNHGYG